MATHVSRFETPEEVVSEIVAGTAVAIGQPVDALSPLENHVDTSTVRRLAAAGTNENVRSGHLRFDYDGVAVTVQADGRLEFGTE